MKLVLLLLALFFIVATALPLIREPYWWVRMFDFPRAQLTIGALLTMGAVYLYYPREAWGDWVLLGALGLAVLYQLWRIYPYTPLHTVQSVQAEEGEVVDARSFRLVVTNVLMDNREGGKWLRTIRSARPDLIVAVETDAWWAEQARALEEEYPHRIEVPQDNTYGILVYSRWPLDDTEIRELVEENVPSVWTHVDLPSGDRVRLVFIHPRPPRPDIPQSSSFRDAELVLVAREVKDHGGPLVVAGDLNDVAWSYTTSLFQKTSGLLDPRIGRGLYSTFHAQNPLMRWPLDHVFHSDDLKLVELRLLDEVGSDHFPILIELLYDPAAVAEQEEPEADAEDEEEAQDILEDEAEERAEETPEEREERQQADR